MKAAMMMIACAVAVSGCATMIKESQTPSYAIGGLDAQALKGKAGEISDVRLTMTSLDFTFRNTTNATSKIIWDESALVMPDGKVAKIAPGNVKAIDADRALKPEIVPATASFDASVVRADSVKLAGFGAYTHWETGSIVPCNTDAHAVFQECDHFALVDKPMTLLLTVENNSKKVEYKIAGKLIKNPEFVAQRAARKASADQRANNAGAVGAQPSNAYRNGAE